MTNVYLKGIAFLASYLVTNIGLLLKWEVNQSRSTLHESLSIVKNKGLMADGMPAEEFKGTDEIILKWQESFCSTYVILDIKRFQNCCWHYYLCDKKVNILAVSMVICQLLWNWEREK